MAVRTGGFDLWLHGGPAPRWLLVRMRRLARGILGVMTSDLGTRGVLQRMSDPLWFQCLSYALAFDWDSSGTTTVTCGVLKSVLKDGELGLRVAGGKGAQSLAAQSEIVRIADEYNLSTQSADKLAYSSRMVAKVDNAAVQDGHQLYHHAMFIDEHGDWTVVQQGLNPQAQTARRYHWLSANVKSFVEEPHTGIQGIPVDGPVLNIVSRDSRNCRKASVDLASEKTDEFRRRYLSIRPANQHALTDWTTTADSTLQSPHYSFSKSNINWKALEEAYELKPDNYEELLSIRGIGPATVRGLALISWLIYGAKPSWQDPLAYTFAFGGKDGVPYPVNRRAMDEAAAYLKQAVEAAEVDKSLKLKAIKALGRAYIRKQ